MEKMNAIERHVQIGKIEITEEIQNGRIPANIGSFQDLHDYIDANELCGFIDENYTPSADFSFETDVHSRLDEWIKSDSFATDIQKDMLPAKNFIPASDWSDSETIASLNLVAKIRTDYEDLFKEPDFNISAATFSDLMWQVLINETTKGKAVTFTVTPTGHGNEIIMASADGGYFKTWVFFKNDVLSDCYPVCSVLNKLVFDQTEDQSREIITKSLF